MDNKDKELLSKIVEHQFTRTALQTVIFDKLMFDGYVCCSNGLYPSNKKVLLDVLPKQSPINDLISTKPKTYMELFDRIEAIKFKINDGESLSFTESQSIVYAILETGDSKQKADVVFFLLKNSVEQTRFYQHGEFIIENDTELVNIESLDQFIAQLEKIPEKTNLLFRGHTNINYSIQPSIFRAPKFYKNEYMMYQELVIRCPEYFISCNSHLDFLVEMQHYGLPTRLLDFTFNPLIALYFACENPSNTGEIIIYSVNNSELYYGKDEKVAILSSLPMFTYGKQKQIFKSISNGFDNSVDIQELIDEVRLERPTFSRKLSLSDIRVPIFVKPSRNNKRIAHQEGAFLLWGLDTVHYDEKFKGEFVGDQEKYRLQRNDKKVVFYVQSKNKGKILKTLNRIGINKAFIYPEIDDVADYLKSTIE